MPINSVNADREAPRVGLKEADAILMTLGDCKKNKPTEKLHRPQFGFSGSRYTLRRDLNHPNMISIIVMSQRV